MSKSLSSMMKIIDPDDEDETESRTWWLQVLEIP